MAYFSNAKPCPIQFAPPQYGDFYWNGSARTKDSKFITGGRYEMSRTSRAKFKVTSKQPWHQGSNVVMQPVYSTDPNHENKAFWDATPGGQIQLGINNQAAFDSFVEGAEYYVDFTPAD